MLLTCKPRHHVILLHVLAAYSLSGVVFPGHHFLSLYIQVRLKRARQDLTEH